MSSCAARKRRCVMPFKVVDITFRVRDTDDMDVVFEQFERYLLGA